MKRLLVFLTILIAVISFANAADSGYDFNFTLKLNKNGTDQVWFAKSKTDTNPNNSVSIHIFPIISAQEITTSTTTGTTTTITTTGSSVSDTVYLHWLKQSSDKVNIKLTFVGNEAFEEGADKKTFMLWSAKNGEESGINFDVTATDANGKLEKSLTFRTSDARLTKQKESDRSFAFNPEESSNGSLTYKSPLKITMTINPASYVYEGDKKTDTTQAKWGVDEQFVGYIKATIIDAT